MAASGITKVRVRYLDKGFVVLYNNQNRIMIAAGVPEAVPAEMRTTSCPNRLVPDPDNAGVGSELKSFFTAR